MNSAAEAIRMGAGLVALGEAIPTKVVLGGDAVWLLAKAADPKAVGQDPIDGAMEMADLADLEICVISEALNAAGLDESDLREYGKLSIVSQEELAGMLAKAGTAFRL
jgi:sulfur relay (sulfurtransferase) DsrF/TusC family protein